MHRRRKVRELQGEVYVLVSVALVLVTCASIIAFVGTRGARTFMGTGVSLWQFITSPAWYPDRYLEDGGPSLGALSFIVGSFTVSGLAVLIATPLGVGAAIFMTEIAPAWGERIIRPAIEVFVSIPSVVYGWIGLSVLVPLLSSVFGGHGFSLLAGGLVLSVMILPTITTVACDALRSIPQGIKEAGYSLGSTRWQVITRVLVPAALSSILTGIILGMARAFGEALAVQMVIGNVRKMPSSVLDPGITLTSGITMEMGNTVFGSLWNNALWSMAGILLIMTLIFVALVRKVSKLNRIAE